MLSIILFLIHLSFAQQSTPAIPLVSMPTMPPFLTIPAIQNLVTLPTIPNLGTLPPPDPVLLSQILQLLKLNSSTSLKLKLTVEPILNEIITCPSALGIFADPKDCTSFKVCILFILKLKLNCLPGFYFEPNSLIFCKKMDPLKKPIQCQSCLAHTKLGNCTNSQSNCSFCVQQDFNKSRCDLFTNLQKGGCTLDKIYNKTSGGGSREIIPVTGINRNITSGVNGGGVNLRPGDRKNVTISFKLRFHPLDLYLLMDISGSMGPHKNSVVHLSSQLESALKNITKDFTLGFGAFSDKVDSYTFKNILPLTNVTSNFSTIVASTPLLYGGDTPEDAGTAIFESIICEKELKWRDSTRKIILVMTDATFHFAKDGTFAGADFEEKCNLDTSGQFNKKNVQDYPPISAIGKIMSEKQVIVIFGVTSYAQSFYVNVSSELKPSAVGTLSSDSSNVIDLLEKEYKKIASHLEIRHSNVTKEIEIKLYSTCGTVNGTATETGVCEDIPLDSDKELKFTVEIGLGDCPKDKTKFNQTLSLSGVGLPYNFEVPIELLCDW